MRALLPLVLALAAGAAVGANNAQFVSQDVPTGMLPGQVYSVTVTMKNTGTTTWTVSGYKLGSQNPENNFTWGMHRVSLLSDTPPGADAVITFNVTAPTTPGTYNFQWRWHSPASSGSARFRPTR
jgi:hypothetical protein